MIATINPATGELVKEFEPHDDAHVDSALETVVAAQRDWARQPLAERVKLLKNVAWLLRERKQEYGRLVTLEMGKPIVEAENEIEKCAWNCDFYADNAPRFVGDVIVPSNATESRVVFDPLGVVLAIMPWNFPFWQTIRFAAPALAAGNGAVLKHASNVPQCSLALEAVFSDAGAPRGLFTTLLLEASRVRPVLEDRRIAAVTLTGSSAVGRQIASQAGAVLKKQVLELGGSDPFIVLADADLEAAARTAVKSRFQDDGQSCIAAKRFIVEEAVADRFTELFCACTRALKVGDPMDRGTQVGPMARGNLRDDLDTQVRKSVAEGARLVLGGHPVDGPGFFYEPTILDGVTPKMTAGREETFGPVAALMRVANADEAIAVANETEYGLGAALWTANVDRARSLARRIEAGSVFINGMVASDPRVPFGGVKHSGYGRELGEFGIREFTNIKTVWIGPAR
jgi:succinate-semialdehyde dehydrogenase/glutarate-semialdehyde dehydrogenase